MATKVIHGRPLAVDLGTGWSGNNQGLIPDTDPGDPITDDDATSMAVYGNAGGAAGTGQPLRFTAFNLPNDISKILSLQVDVRYRSRDARATFRTIVGVGGVYGFGPTVNVASLGTWFDHASGAIANPEPDSGGVWLPAHLLDPTFVYGIEVTAWQDGASPGQLFDVSTLHPLTSYEPVPPQIGSTRDVPSRRSWYFRRSEPLMRRRLDLADGLSFDLLDLVPVSHHLAPHETDQGWLESRPKRRLMQALETTEDPNRNLVETVLRDMRPYLCLYRDTAWSLTSAAPWAEGVSRFSRRGAVQRTFARASRAWVPDPADGQIVQIEADQEKLAQGGLLIEGQRKNLVHQSGFRNGLTGWTVAGASGGSSITIPTGASARHYFKTKVVSGSAPKLVWAAASGVDLRLVRAAATASQAASTKVSVSVAHFDESGEVLFWALQRDVDSWWWDETGQSWGAAKTWNALPLASSGFVRHQAAAGVDVGASPTGLTIETSVPNASGVDGQVNWVGHAQIEVGDYMTSPMLTEASEFTREADSLKVSNNWDARSWLAEQGAFALEALAGWTAAQIGNTNKTLFYVEYDANDYEWAYYDGTNDRFVFERSRAGNLTRAVYATPPPGDWVRLVFRHTGEEGELDLAPYTASLFVDGVKGTDASDAGGPPGEEATSDLELGSKNGAEHWDGQLRLLHSYQYVPTDGEAARMPPQ